jgi:glycerol-3-phosphate acyltransferase PlsY
MTLALNWKLALVLALVSVLITLLTDYIALATTATAITVPVYFGIATRSLIPPLILLIATAVIVLKHWDNYRRILKGEEMGLRGVSKGKYRIN